MSKGTNKKKSTPIPTWKNEKTITHDLPEKKKRSLWSRTANYIIGKQIELPLKIISVVILSYLVTPTPHNPFSRLLFLSYPTKSTDSKGNDTIVYGKGYWDLAFIAFWIVVFTLTREIIMQYILRPFAIWAGVKSKRKITRFMEQGYVALYCIISTTIGLSVMRDSPYWFYRTDHFWIDYPHYVLKPLVKSYYLVQFSFWLQQIIVLILQLEKPRKDFLEMVAHHIITCLLIGGSYLFNFTRIGNAVFITMDFSDIFLSIAKSMKYLAFPGIITDMMFVLFMITWVYTRHYLYGLIIYSTWAESCLPENNKCIWDPLNGYWLTWWSRYIILLGLVLLQILIVYWFMLIIRIAWSVVTGKNAEDTRSDTEGDEDISIEPENPTNTKKTR